MTDQQFRQLAAINPREVLYIIKNNQIQNFTKACLVSYLGFGLDDDIIDSIKDFTNDPSPLVREGAYISLSNYFIEDSKKYFYLYEYFTKSLESETGEGVIKQIKSLLELMDMYKE